MLYVTMKDGNDFSCHVGGNMPSIAYSHTDVDTIQADGHELEKCLKLVGRESVPNRVWTFCGHDAHIIFLNW